MSRLPGWAVVTAAVVMVATAVAVATLPGRPALLVMRGSVMAALWAVVVACFWTGMRARGAERSWRLLFGVMLLGLSAGHMVIMRDTVRTFVAIPVLTASSLPYLVFWAIGMAGLLHYPTDPYDTGSRAGGRGLLWRVVAGLNSLIVVGALALLAWVSVLAEGIANAGGMRGPSLYLFALTIAVQSLVAVLIMMVVLRRPRQPLGLALLVGAVLSFSVSIMIHLYARARGISDVPRLLELGFLAGPLLAGLAVLVPPAAADAGEGEEDAGRGGARGGGPAAHGLAAHGLAAHDLAANDAAPASRQWWHVALPYLPVLIAGVASAIYLGGRRASDFGATVTIWAILGLLLLVLVRQLATMIDNAWLLLRLERDQQKLRHQAFHDSLTGLPNRALFDERLAHALRRRARQPGRMAVLFCDLDDFKHVNDALGHAAGDELLKTTARRLRESVRAADTVARFGGDEFAVLLEPDVDDPQGVARRLARTVRAPLALAGTTFSVAASVGLVVVDPAESPVSPETLLHRADLAMYAAKVRSKGDVTVYRPELSAPLTEAALRSRLAAAVRGDPGGGELAVDYRPVVDLVTGLWAGYEAELTWWHPDLGMVRPGMLLPSSAGGAGVALALDRLLLCRACRDAAGLPVVAGRRPAMHVTVAAARLGEEALYDDAIAVLDRTGLPADRLVLQISETSRAPDLAATVREAGRLHSAGVRLGLAGVGGTDTAVDTLLVLPVDFIRLTPALTRTWLALRKQGRVAIMLESFLSTMIGVGVAVIADGVDNPETVSQLLARGCRLATGDLFAGPVQFVPAGADSPGQTRADR